MDNDIINQSMRHQKGFTLVEVLVALVIAAVALSALSRALGLTVSNQSALETRLIATWVAQDTLLQQQMFPAQPLPKQTELMGRQWMIKREFLPTLVPNYQQVRIDITQGIEGVQKSSSDASLASIVAAKES